MEKKTKYYIVIVLIALIVISFAVIFSKKIQNVFISNPNSQNSVMLNNVKAGVPIINLETKSYTVADMQKEIADLQLSLASGKLSLSEEAGAKLLLGYDQLFMSDGKDVQNGAKLLKEVIANSVYPEQIRAEAIFHISLMNEITPNWVFASMYYFNEDNSAGSSLFKNIKSESAGNISVAFAKLNELSDQLYPDPLANYWIASIYAYQVSKSDATAEKKTFYIAEAKKRITRGDSLMSKLEGEKGQEIKKMLAYENKALALTSLYFAKEAGIDPNEISVLYEKAIAALDGVPEGETKKIFSHYPRYYYASFLAMSDKSKNSEKIKELVAPICGEVEISKYAIYYFLKMAKNIDDKGASKTALSALSVASPEFKQLVEKIEKF